LAKYRDYAHWPGGTGLWALSPVFVN